MVLNRLIKKQLALLLALLLFLSLLPTSAFPIIAHATDTEIPLGGVSANMASSGTTTYEVHATNAFGDPINSEGKTESEVEPQSFVQATVMYKMLNGMLLEYTGIDGKPGGSGTSSTITPENYTVIPDGILVIPHVITTTGGEKFRITTVGGAIAGSFSATACYPFRGNQTIRTVILEDGIEAVYNGAFAGGSSVGTDSQISSIVIPDSVTAIGQSAFSGHKVDNIVIGSKLENLISIARKDSSTTTTTINNTSFGADTFSSSVMEGITFLSPINAWANQLVQAANLSYIVYPDTIGSFTSAVNIRAGLDVTVLPSAATTNQTVTLVGTSNALYVKKGSSFDEKIISSNKHYLPDNFQFIITAASEYISFPDGTSTTFDPRHYRAMFYLYDTTAATIEKAEADTKYAQEALSRAETALSEGSEDVTQDIVDALTVELAYRQKSEAAIKKSLGCTESNRAEFTNFNYPEEIAVSDITVLDALFTAHEKMYGEATFANAFLANPSDNEYLCVDNDGKVTKAFGVESEKWSFTYGEDGDAIDINEAISTALQYSDTEQTLSFECEDAGTAEPTVDKSGLNELIATAKTKTEADYTVESWTIFASALGAAETVSAKADATQEGVDSALAALQSAIDTLDENPVEPTVDKSELDALIATVESKVEADYTAESWAVFASALSEASTVSSDEDATQSKVDNALAVLKNALQQLVPLNIPLGGVSATMTATDIKTYEVYATNAFGEAINSQGVTQSNFVATAELTEWVQTTVSYGLLNGMLMTYTGVDGKPGGSGTSTTIASANYSAIPDGVLVIPHIITTTAGEKYRITMVGGAVAGSITVTAYYPFRGNISIRTVILEDGIKSVCNAAFRDCSKITSIVIPDSVTAIAVNAFYGHGVDEIVVGRSLGESITISKVTSTTTSTTTSKDAFVADTFSSDALKKITFLSPIKSWTNRIVTASNLAQIIYPDTFGSIASGMMIVAGSDVTVLPSASAKATSTTIAFNGSSNFLYLKKSSVLDEKISSTTKNYLPENFLFSVLNGSEEVKFSDGTSNKFDPRHYRAMYYLYDYRAASVEKAEADTEAARAAHAVAQAAWSGGDETVTEDAVNALAAEHAFRQKSEAAIKHALGCTESNRDEFNNFHYGENIAVSDVTVLDALFTAHEKMYGETTFADAFFANPTDNAYLCIDKCGTVTKAFGIESVDWGFTYASRNYSIGEAASVALKYVDGTDQALSFVCGGFAEQQKTLLIGMTMTGDQPYDQLTYVVGKGFTAGTLAGRGSSASTNFGSSVKAYDYYVNLGTKSVTFDLTAESTDSTVDITLDCAVEGSKLIDAVAPTADGKWQVTVDLPGPVPTETSTTSVQFTISNGLDETDKTTYSVDIIRAKLVDWEKSATMSTVWTIDGKYYPNEKTHNTVIYPRFTASYDALISLLTISDATRQIYIYKNEQQKAILELTVKPGSTVTFSDSGSMISGNHKIIKNDTQFISSPGGRIFDVYTVEYYVVDSSAMTLPSIPSVVVQTMSRTARTFDFQLVYRSTHEGVYTPDTLVDFQQGVTGQYVDDGRGATSVMRGVGGWNHYISLGGLGGYATYKYDVPIKNDPLNPYGIDFVIVGNAFSAGAFPEPGSVEVSADGTNWYYLAGQRHYELATVFMKAPYYKRTPWSIDEPYTTMYFDTMRIYKGGGGWNWYEVQFGYVDVAGCSGTDNGEGQWGIDGEPHNPYVYRSVANIGDVMDISWAVDEYGKPVYLDSISYIRIQNTMDSTGSGGLSPEPGTIVRTDNYKSTAGEIAVTEDLKTLTVAGTKIIENGTNISSLTPVGTSSNGTAITEYYEINANSAGMAIVDVEAQNAGTNIFVNNKRFDDKGTYNGLFASDGSLGLYNQAGELMIRVIVQRDELQPRIYVFKVTGGDPEAAKVNTDLESVIIFPSDETSLVKDDDSYKASVPNAVERISFLANAFNPNATSVRLTAGDGVTGAAWLPMERDGRSEQTFALNDGDNRFTIEVTAADGSTIYKYPVIITRETVSTGMSVKFKMIGDVIHTKFVDDGGDGYYESLEGVTHDPVVWIEEHTVTNIPVGATVKYVTDLVMQNKGITMYTDNEGAYIKYLEKESVKLGEFTNGHNSGWMYTYQGNISNLGYAQQTVRDGSTIEWFYTDDYTVEQPDEGDWEKVDKSNLLLAIEEADEIMKYKELYTVVSATALQNVLNDAKAVKDNADATQEAVNAAEAAIDAAIAGLVKVGAAVTGEASEGVLSATVDNSVVENQVTSQTDTVSIAIQPPSGGTGDTPIKTVAAELASDALLAVKNASGKGLEIVSSLGAIKFDSDAVETLNSGAGSNALSLKLEVKSEDTDGEGLKTKTIDITATANGTNAFAQGTAGIATITIPFNLTAGKEIKVTFNGTSLPNVSYANGYVTFETSHFSEYVISEAEPEVTVKLGDVNGDNSITNDDAILILRYVASLTDPGFIVDAADVDGKGGITNDDAIEILRHVAGLSSALD